VVDLFGCAGRDFVMLTVQPMSFDVFHVYRLESSEAHVKSDLRRLDISIS
jgi:hypothetical protein